MARKRLFLLLLFALTASGCFCLQPFSLPSSPSSVAVNTGNGEVFVAAGDQLLRLDRQLELLESVDLPMNGELLRIALSPNNRWLVGCLGGNLQQCLVYNSSDLSDGPSTIISNINYFTENGMALIATDDSFYVGSQGINSQGDSKIRLSQYNYTSAMAVRDSEYSVAESGFSRLFYGGYARNNFVYFFVADRGNNAIRVLRVCECNQSCSSQQFEALYELDLRCFGEITEQTEICGVTLLESFVGRSEPMVVVSQCDPESRSRICGYLLSDIDGDMDGSYEQCRDNIQNRFQLSWRFFTLCTQFSPSDICALGNTPPAFAAVQQSGLSVTERFGFFFINPGGTMIMMTAGLALKVEDVSLVYGAYDGGISVFEVTRTRISNPPTGRPVDTIMDVPAVRDLNWVEGSDYITVTTDDNVMQIPLERCSEMTTCEECASEDAFPLCGWCTLEEKCSRRSQCQNYTEEGRWVKDSDQCIDITVSPDQFVLETPTILNVTATPSISPNLSYNCSFTWSGNVFPVVVPAVEVTPGTEYQCNITGIVTDLSTVITEANFSFVSLEIGIPFATTENALTIFDCDAADSCGDCVETGGICGWCLYGGICSGTPDLVCPVLNNSLAANNSYLLLEDGLSYEDVCPILEPASTPSGHYTQPVRVARNLPLQTRNLPTPVEGFEYRCRFRDLPETVAEFSDGNVTCLVMEGMLTLMTSQRETISFELIWTNGSVQYALDENNYEDIKCTIYDCMELASECSFCLGVNVAGFQCGWCSTSMDQTCSVMEECDNVFTTSTSDCPSPLIDSVEPESGPPDGGTRIRITGTNLGAEFSDIQSVTLQGNSSESTPCQLIMEDYTIGSQIGCETGVFTKTGTYRVVVEVQRDSDFVQAEGSFRVEQPVVSEVIPPFGPKSGGVEVAVRGSGLDIGNSEYTQITLNGVNCTVNMVSNEELFCTAFALNGGVAGAVSGPVYVFIDDATVNATGVNFEYRDDPEYVTITPRYTIIAGGINLTFEGASLNAAAEPKFVFIATGRDKRSNEASEEGNCTTISETRLVCLAPAFPSLAENVPYTIRVGNAPGPNLTLEDLMLGVRPNPEFAKDGSAIVDAEHQIGEGALLNLLGSNLDSVERNEIMVIVGGEGKSCNVSVGGLECEDRTTEDDVNQYVCQPPDESPTASNEAAVRVYIGTNLCYDVGTLTYVEDTKTDLQQIYIIAGSVVGGVLLFSGIIIVIIIGCYTIRAKEKDKQFTNLLVQMELWEVEMADECKRAFTELQTDLADLVQISDDKNLPYRDFRSFAMRFLFPSAGEDHPVLNPLAIPNGNEVVPHLENFRQLILDKKFLLLFVRTLEAQQGRFSLQDKCNVASLLMVAFQNDLDYATDILKTLLSEVMQQTVGKSLHPKLLLRRTESVAEKMLANWLSFLLFPYLLEHAGEPLFILYRAIKSQLEKGPVDVITGEARHSLSEEKLLRQKFDAKPVEGLVEMENGESVAVKLLDCDTVTQAKEKILDVLYKNTAISKRPQLTDVDLELRRANAGVTLRDHDNTNVKEGEWTKINTLGHYKLDEMSQAAISNPRNPTPRFKLVPRPNRPVSGAGYDIVGTIIANLNTNNVGPVTHSISDGSRVFHLVKQDTGDMEDGTGPRQGKILSEVFLTRLLSTKRILQPYVDDLFKVIFAVPRGRQPPKAIKYLFDFLDLQASELGIQDPEILHTWKTNSLPLRFWVNLIKNPDFVFDIHKSATVDACLTIIAGAYIDACSTTDLKYSKDTPSARLLYVNEVKSYKQDVQQYYGTVQSQPKLSDYEMAEYLRETAQVCAHTVSTSCENDNDSKNIFMTRQLYFVTESALYELFKYVVQYSDEIHDALNDEGLSLMASKLEQLRASIKV